MMADGPLARRRGPPGGSTTWRRAPGSRCCTGGDWAYDPSAEVWRPHALIEAGTEREDLSADQLGDLLDAGSPIPAWVAPAAVARELRRVRRPRSERGLVLFLTGLSGSGKSTIARDLADVLAERSDRQVSLLDGDLVRQLLSAGLTFSRADRDLNIARIGFVAAEIARHGGIAICAPIAPFAAARAQVRRMVSEVGDFFLSTSRRRSRCARHATGRACMPRPGRRNRSVHRRVRSIRGASGRRAGDRHIRHEPAGRRAGGVGDADIRRLAGRPACASGRC